MEELEALLPRAQNGDLEAYGQIVHRFQDMAVGYARSILKDAHLAEDVAQEAFIEAYLNLSRVYGPHAFPGWLRKIVFKFCNRLTRKKQVQFVSLEDAGELRSGDKDPAEILDEKDAQEFVQASLENLPEQERTVVNLFYINEFSQREVAAFLELPVTTINFRLHSARKQLKKEYIKMTRTNLQTQRPSKDRKFADRVQNDLQAVQKLHNNLLSPLEKLFTRSLGREVEVEIVEAHQRAFGYYTQSLGKFCCNYCFDMEPLQGRVYLDLSLPLCASVLQPDADPDAIRQQVEEKLSTPIGEAWVTPDEIQTLNSNAKHIIEALEEAWKPVREMQITNIELETVPSFIPGEPAAPAIDIVMKVKTEGCRDLTLSLCYYLSTLEPTLPDLK